MQAIDEKPAVVKIEDFCFGSVVGAHAGNLGGDLRIGLEIPGFGGLVEDLVGDGIPEGECDAGGNIVWVCWGVGIGGRAVEEETGGFEDEED